jgi:exodeoxyribonuclease VII small subunit
MVKKDLRKSKNYRQMSEELAELIEWFESQDPDIDRALEKYNQAMALIEQMEEYLKTAENRIRKISIR